MFNSTVLDNYHNILSFIEDLIEEGFYKSLKDTEKDILLTAFIHKSYAADYTPPLVDNERVEFLGDGVLGWAIASMLYQQFPTRSEATLTLYKIALVREEMLAKVARDISLAEKLFVSKGEEKQWGRDKDTILADAYEALIGALYIIYGYDCVYRLIEKTLFRHIHELQQTECKSYKSLVQEWAQKQWYPLPSYESIEKNLPWSKESLFETIISINNKVVAIGHGKNKKRSQEDAATKAYTEVYLQ